MLARHGPSPTAHPRVRGLEPLPHGPAWRLLLRASPKRMRTWKDVCLGRFHVLYLGWIQQMLTLGSSFNGFPQWKGIGSSRRSTRRQVLLCELVRARVWSLRHPQLMHSQCLLYLSIVVWCSSRCPMCVMGAGMDQCRPRVSRRDWLALSATRCRAGLGRRLYKMISASIPPQSLPVRPWYILHFLGYWWLRNLIGYWTNISTIFYNLSNITSYIRYLSYSCWYFGCYPV